MWNSFGPTTDDSGRPGLGVGYTHDGIRQILVLDSNTSDILGQETVTLDLCNAHCMDGLRGAIDRRVPEHGSVGREPRRVFAVADSNPPKGPTSIEPPAPLGGDVSATPGSVPGPDVEADQPHSGRHPRRGLQGLLAFGSYLLVAFLLYAVPVLGRFGSVFAGKGGGDAKIYVWALAWWPHAFSQGINPFFTNVVWAQTGTNLAWVTSLPGPGVALWPATHLFGPVAALNLATVLAPALAAWATYLVCRRAVSGFWPALAGGYLFGFSSYMVVELQGHINLFLIFTVPLAVYLVIRDADGSMPWWRFIPLLAVDLAFLFATSTEVFASVAFFGAFAMLGALAFTPGARKRLVQTSLRILAALAAAGVLLAPILFYVARNVPTGPLRPVAQGSSSLDAASLLIPKQATLIGGEMFRRYSARFAGSPEMGAYLGPALIVILVIIALTMLRDRITRLSLLFALFAAVCSLGTILHAGGWTSSIPLPWKVFVQLPLLQNALPSRFTMYMWLGIAVAVARWLDAPARRAPTEQAEGSPSPVDLAVPGPRVWWRFGLVAIAGVMLLPNIALPSLHGAAGSPAFFTQGLYHRYLQPGETIVFIHPGKGDEMLAQVDAHFSFKLAQGHTGIAPPPFRGSPGFSQIDKGIPTGLTPTVLSEFLNLHRVTAVVVQDSVAGLWRPLLTGTLRVQPVAVGGVEVYQAPPGQLGFQFGGSVRVGALAPAGHLMNLLYGHQTIPHAVRRESADPAGSRADPSTSTPVWAVPRPGRYPTQPG